MKYFVLALTLFVCGCGVKEEYRGLVNDDAIYTQSIAYTKKAVFKENGESQALFSITYLNPLYGKRYSEYEFFLVGGYAYDSDINLQKELDYTISLDGMEPLSIEKANLNDFKSLPLITKWSKYYLIKFEKTQRSDLNLFFMHPQMQDLHLIIIKDRGK